MEFGLTPEREALLGSVVRFREDHCNATMVAKWDDEGVYPDELYRKIADMGWLGLGVPEEYGGSAGTIEDQIVVYEALGAYSTDLPARLLVTALAQENLLKFGTDEQRDRYLRASVDGDVKFTISITEPEAGSDAASLRTRAVATSAGYTISGQKLFSSAANSKDNVMIVAARTKSIHEAPKQAGISLFFVPSSSPGLEFRRLRTVGRHILGTYEVFFDDVVVPPDALLGTENEGWNQLADHLERERILLAAAYLGAAGSVVHDAVAYANERVQFGAPIGKKQAIRHMLADMSCAYEAGRLMTYRAAWRYARKLPCKLEASQAKLYVSEMLADISTKGMQILGGHGFTYDHHMQRYWRDARNGPIGGGSSQIQRELIARELGL